MGSGNYLGTAAKVSPDGCIKITASYPTEVKYGLFIVFAIVRSPPVRFDLLASEFYISWQRCYDIRPSNVETHLFPLHPLAAKLLQVKLPPRRD